MYHRVAPLRQPDPWALAVEPERFEQQIAYLKQKRTILSMDRLVNELRSNTLPGNAVAVTFDDGYCDNLIYAMPVLARYGVPATVFVATGYIDRNEPYWWDELAAQILGSPKPEQHWQECGGDCFKLSWGEQERADGSRDWRGWDEPRTARQRSFYPIWHKLKYTNPQERELTIAMLRRRFGTMHDRLALPMSGAELHQLIAADLINLGAHSVTHPALNRLSRSECRREIAESKRQCTIHTGKPTNGFAYPYGELSPHVQDDVARESFAWACSTQESFLDMDKPNFYSLPRIAARNVSLRTFVESIGS